MDTWEGFYPELPSAICWLAAPHTFTTYCAAPHPHNRCISALASNHASCSLVEASRGLMPPHRLQGCGDDGCLLPLLEQLTLALVAAGGVGACDEEPWLHDCTEMMLEVGGGVGVWEGTEVSTVFSLQEADLAVCCSACLYFRIISQAILRSLYLSFIPVASLHPPPQAWSALLQPEVHSAFLAALPASAPPPQPQPAAPHAASVFRAVVEAALRDAAAGAHEVRSWSVWCGGGLQVWAALKQDFLLGRLRRSLPVDPTDYPFFPSGCC